ncbi:MAG: GntR family transcriptional regulator [Candidatus Sumerlaeaceae bacterium]|nr:GntR family transcriptional regulator [Candidatus Sumerlaeaceae bacterium]
MFFEVDFNDSKAVYQQLMDQVKFAVASGRIQPGDRLPSIRDVAIQVRVNRNTVARVYGELEREGIIYSRAGQGAFISDRGSSLSRAEQRRQLTARLDELITQARLFDITREKITEWFQERLNAIFPEPEGTGTPGGRK